MRTTEILSEVGPWRCRTRRRNLFERVRAPRRERAGPHHPRRAVTEATAEVAALWDGGRGAAGLGGLRFPSAATESLPLPAEQRHSGPAPQVVGVGKPAAPRGRLRGKEEAELSIWTGGGSGCPLPMLLYTWKSPQYFQYFLAVQSACSEAKSVDPCLPASAPVSCISTAVFPQPSTERCVCVWMCVDKRQKKNPHHNSVGTGLRGTSCSVSRQMCTVSKYLLHMQYLLLLISPFQVHARQDHGSSVQFWPAV